MGDMYIPLPSASLHDVQEDTEKIMRQFALHNFFRTLVTTTARKDSRVKLELGQGD